MFRRIKNPSLGIATIITSIAATIPYNAIGNSFLKELFLTCFVLWDVICITPSANRHIEPKYTTIISLEKGSLDSDYPAQRVPPTAKAVNPISRVSHASVLIGLIILAISIGVGYWIFGKIRVKQRTWSIKQFRRDH